MPAKKTATKNTATQTAQHLDVLIIGAGISGIGAACHLTRKSPGKRYAILERRQAMGGTWDLFRYPGIRSDSDMYTFGYNFKPWTQPKVLSDGADIKDYVQETARDYGVDRHIQYGIKVTHAAWSSATQTWTVSAEREESGEALSFTCSFLLGCTGYYNYDRGFQPDFAGLDQYQGTFIHPQHWPEDLDYSGKKVVVIGSGATAITLVPNLAGKAAHVTMLQRSPTYILSLPAIDPVSSRMMKVLPAMVAYRISRTRNIALQRSMFRMARNRPKAMRRLLLMMVHKQIGNSCDMRHFTPSYNPWDQRLCVVPNGDLFKAIRRGQASVATDEIDTFTKNGIRLKSGETLEADIVVSATGLNVQLLGGVQVQVDGKPVNSSEHLMYKGVMLEGVPNAALVVGYTNASWTLKADIAAEYVCRLLNYMDKHGQGQVVARDDTASIEAGETILGGLNSGYIQRAADILPRQGVRRPWRILQDYMRDVPALRHAPIRDKALHFSRKVRAPASASRKAVSRRGARTKAAAAAL